MPSSVVSVPPDFGPNILVSLIMSTTIPRRVGGVSPVQLGPKEPAPLSPRTIQRSRYAADESPARGDGRDDPLLHSLQRVHRAGRRPDDGPRFGPCEYPVDGRV